MVLDCFEQIVKCYLKLDAWMLNLRTLNKLLFKTECLDAKFWIYVLFTTKNLAETKGNAINFSIYYFFYCVFSLNFSENPMLLNILLLVKNPSAQNIRR